MKSWGEDYIGYAMSCILHSIECAINIHTNVHTHIHTHISATLREFNITDINSLYNLTRLSKSSNAALEQLLASFTYHSSFKFQQNSRMEK